MTPLTKTPSTSSTSSTPNASTPPPPPKTSTITTTTTIGTPRQTSAPAKLGPFDLKLPKNEFVPVAIRSGTPFTNANADGKRPNLFRFVPNVKSTTTPCSGASTPNHRRIKYELNAENDLDIGAMLAHSLTLKNIQQGRPSVQDLHLRRSSAPGGALGARNAADRRAMSVNAKVQQHLQSIRRKKGKKSMNVLEMSWMEGPGGLPYYTPITLPYVAFTDPNEPQDNEINKSKRPTSRHIDETNRHAASLFDDQTFDDELKDHRWLLIQFPGVLPAIHKDVKTANKNDVGQDYCASQFEGLPEGALGKLCIYKSGKVVFKAGNHQFDVNHGSDCNFSQEVACGVGNGTELMFLGRCSKRMIITPNLSHYVT